VLPEKDKRVKTTVNNKYIINYIFSDLKTVFG
jgi:hypothetical protein